MSICKAFNTHFQEFIDDVLRILPNNKDIKTAKFYIGSVIKINPTLLIKGWREYITYPYDTDITNCDFSFFLEKDYNEDLNYLKDNNKMLNAINLIKDQARLMSEQNKNNIIKYIKNLTKLSKLYNA
tara:strand:- start:8871 stop:9251 length:381 start_codon:yes stop_codon:yes gene_type:complete